jgi:hypothetical protein
MSVILIALTVGLLLYFMWMVVTNLRKAVRGIQRKRLHDKIKKEFAGIGVSGGRGSKLVLSVGSTASANSSGGSPGGSSDRSQPTGTASPPTEPAVRFLASPLCQWPTH